MMSNDKAKRIEKAMKKRGQLVVAYLLAGYPSRNGFLDAMKQVTAAGADIIEVGFPSRNPVNDGQVIREAHQQVDMSIQDDMAYWAQVRNATDVPIWLMGYREDLVNIPRYRQLVSAGIADALVLPELSMDESLRLHEEVGREGCEVLGFVNGQLPETQVRKVFSNHRLIYVQLYVGQTGAKAAQDNYKDNLRIAKDYPDVLIFAGFGIDSPERVNQLLRQKFDGVILGTAVIRQQNQSEESLQSFISGIRAAADKERTP